jgi:membrane protease YdiL (CAAX protease family)
MAGFGAARDSVRRTHTRRLTVPTLLEKPVAERTRRLTTIPVDRPSSREPSSSHIQYVSPEQHSLPRSIALHLLPGAALFGFVLVVAALGIPAILGLLVGIALVVVPIELGYLLYQGWSKTGRWSVWEVVDYREPMPARRIAMWAVPLVAWFILMLFLSVAVLDERIADGLFSWYPESVREFASFEGDTTYTTWVVVVVFAAAVAINGILGPVVEELYFRGHLLPRIDRFGRGAPVLNAVLFSLYHFWTPWQNIGRILGLLPWIYTVWGKRSVALSMAIHISVNCIFLLLVLAAISAD